MYFSSGAVHSAVVDQRIRDYAVKPHDRLVDRSRAGTAALDHADNHDAELLIRSGLWYIESMQLDVKKPRQASL